MGAVFSKPKMPKLPPPPPPPPTVDDAARSEEFSAKLARRRGRMATLRSKGSAAPSVAVRTLLGGP
ncbi:MAG: hypothetical protein BroJett013_07190 [Alphaproteobacteria bacterium]|nr:MAG: hypothetical protein BroJett013_07190 [Alphaproteobacteria bacterium]